MADIFKRLDLLSYIRSLSVCVSWRSVPAKTLNHCRPASTPPWLLLSNTPNDPPDSRSLYAFDSTCKISKRINFILPQIAGFVCVGSSQGFLINIDLAGKLTAINPLTGACFPLPPTAHHPDILVGRPPTLTTPDPTNKVEIYHQKAVISPSMDTIAVLSKGVVTLSRPPPNIQDFCNIAFATAGDDSWTYLFSDPTDIILHRDYLYAVRSDGSLDVFDIKNPTALPLVSSKPCLRRTCPVYLTETPDGEDLLLLRRRESRSGPSTVKVAEMAVFKLDKNRLQWNEVQSIGDVALFFGAAYLSSLSTLEFPCFKRNHIYFTSRYLPYPEQNVDDVGVYDLKNGSIQPLPSSVDIRQLHWPPPIWFTPRF